MKMGRPFAGDQPATRFTNSKELRRKRYSEKIDVLSPLPVE